MAGRAAEDWQGQILSIKKLSRRFGAHQVLRSLDLEVETGARVALSGPNGSGKTTLLRCLAGTLIPTSGEILIAGHKAGTLEARRLIGVSLSQERSFYLRLSGRANLRFFARLRWDSERTATRQVRELEEELEITELASLRVDRCSTGMIQQLAFARALLGRPKLLLLDEPTRSLDDDAIKRFWAAIERRTGVALILATHREDDLMHCEERLDLGI